jgi:hypothetical protein
MKNILELLSRFFLRDMGDSIPGKSSLSMRIITNVMAVFSLIFAYVLGCRAFYHYLEPEWGEMGSLSILGGFLASTSILLWIVSWMLKPKDSTSTKVITAIEKAVEGIPLQGMVKKVTDMPKDSLMLLGVAFLAYYLSSHTKKDV